MADLVDWCIKGGALGSPLGQEGEQTSPDPYSIQQLSLSPKHTTPFSVTDILSPLDSGFLSQGSTYCRMQTSGSGMGTPSTMTNAYGSVPQYHSGAFSTQYCNGSELTPYGDHMRSPAGWYSAAPDPRFASKSKFKK